jgi:hypothetical protein
MQATGTITVSERADVLLAIRLGFDPADFRVKATVWCDREFVTARGDDFVFSARLRVVGVSWNAKGEVVFVWQESDYGKKVRVKPRCGVWYLTLTRESVKS